jgi:hypothetical protein
LPRHNVSFAFVTGYGRDDLPCSVRHRCCANPSPGKN